MFTPEDVGAFVVRALEAIDAGGLRADKALKKILRKAPDLDNEQRAFIAQVVHGVRCWEGTLAFLLDCTEDDELVRDRADRRAAAYARLHTELGSEEVAALWPDAGDAYALAAGEWQARIPEEPSHRLAIVHSMPLWVVERLLATRDPEEVEAMLRAMNEPAPVWLRANALHVTATDLQAHLEEEGVKTTPGPLPASLKVEGRLNVRGDPAWQAGLFDVQDLGSQAIAAAVAAQPGECVVDLCAGRGGKTLALAADLQNEGELWATDVDAEALLALEHRTKRAGVKGLHVQRLTKNTEKAAKALAGLTGRADAVLVDAPCSSLGTLRRGPDHRWRVFEEDLEAEVERQLEVLTLGATLVRPGGRLIYATCSILEDENEDVAAAFEALHADFAPLDLLPDFPLFGSGPTLQLTPHLHGTDGFFIAGWRRASDG